MKNNKGFTLVELLATIVILALVLSITMYIAINVINNAKEKTYQVTLNNIVANANSYLTENGNKMIFVKASGTSVEYQCLKVQNLIDTGYLDNKTSEAKIAENKTINPEDYIYIERDITTKTITKVEYMVDSHALSNVCKVSSNIRALIEFNSVPDKLTWSTKKDVEITYTVKNINDVEKLSGFNYDYSYGTGNDAVAYAGTFSDYVEKEQLVITKPVTIVANVAYGTKPAAYGIYSISKIDNTGPVISLASDPVTYAKKQTKITLKVTDSQSGVNRRSFTTEDLQVTIGGEPAKSFTLSKGTANATQTVVNYVLTIEDDEHNGSVHINVPDNTVFDNLDNGNTDPDLELGIKFDNIPPTISLTSTNDLKSATQTLTLKCNDETNGSGLAGYYYGVTAPDESTTLGYGRASELTQLKRAEGMSKTVDAANIYYLVCGDVAGNRSEVESISINSYTVKNRLLTVTGTYNSYTSGNYDQVSSNIYLAPKGTSIVLANVYTIPTGSSSIKFRGYSKGNASTSVATLSTTNPTLASNVIYTMWFNRNYLNFRFKPNGGQVTPQTIDDDDETKVYNWGVDADGYITLGGSNLFYQYRYGKTSIDLPHPRNANYMQVIKEGYTTIAEKEWMCISGCGTANQIFSQKAITGDVSDIPGTACDLATQNCDIDLKVNWVPTVAKPTTAYCKSNLVYNGSSQTLVNSAGTGFTWTSGTTRTNAGSQDVTAHLSEGYAWADSSTADVTISCSIAKLPITVTATDQSKTYDGSALAADATCSKTGGTLLSGHTVTCTNTGSQTNAGSSAKTLSTVTIKSGSTNVTSNYNITKRNGTLAVNKRTVTVTAPTVVSSSLTSNGSNQELLSTAGSCSAGGTMYWYSSNPSTSSSTPSFSASSGWTTTRPTSYNGKDAATYYIYYYCRVTDTTNNQGSDINAVKYVSKEIEAGTPTTPPPAPGGGNCSFTKAAGGCTGIGTIYASCTGYEYKASGNCNGSPQTYNGKNYSYVHACQYATCSYYNCAGSLTTTSNSTYVYSDSVVCPAASSGTGTCFLAGTKLMTPDGYKDIDKINEGDMVLSYDGNENVYKEVIHHFIFENNENNEELYTLTFDDMSTLKVTSKHRFYIERNNMCDWLAAEKIIYGDIVKYADGTYHKVIKTEHEILTQPVYNISVDGTHNFYVGEQQVLVHNVTVTRIGKENVGLK